MISLGPSGDVKYILTRELSDLMHQHSKYQINLPLWERYIIWIYTVNSSYVNKYLINRTMEYKMSRWVYLFFKLFSYKLEEIGKPFRKFLNFFQTPENYKNLPSKDKNKISEIVINEYVLVLEKIILNAPKTSSEITVYKASTYYPELPEKIKEHHEIVFQKPFNSTSYDPQLNFSVFLPNVNCCMFKLKIPKSSSVLMIDYTIHAHPYEREILLPFGVRFDISNITDIKLNYRQYQNTIPVQNEPYSMGELYKLETDLNDIKSMNMKLYSVKVL